MITSRIKTAIFVGALLAQPMQTRTYANDYSVAGSDDAIGVIAGLGIMAAGCYAVYAGLNYLFTPSDETIINNAQSVESKVYTYYTPVMNYLGSAQYAMNESVLYGLAQNYVRGSFSSYKQGMSNTLNEIRSSLKNLNDRMRSLDDNGRRYSNEYMVMGGLASRLGAIELELRRTYEALHLHSSFFELYALDATIRNDYVNVLRIVEGCGSDRWALAQSLHNYVATPASYYNPYPMLSYVETLDNNVCVLGNAINKCAYPYANLLAGANDIYSKLYTARSVLMADNRYAYEMQAREQARREQARLERERLERERLERMRLEQARLERERIAAQYAVANAKAEARELERQNAREQQKQENARKARQEEQKQQEQQARVERERKAREVETQRQQDQARKEAKAAQKNDDRDLQLIMGFE